MHVHADYVNSTGVNHSANEEDWSSDSAVSSMASPAQQVSSPNGLWSVNDSSRSELQLKLWLMVWKYVLWYTLSQSQTFFYFLNYFDNPYCLNWVQTILQTNVHEVFHCISNSLLIIFLYWSFLYSYACFVTQLSLRHVADEYEVTNEDGATGGIPKYEMYQTKSEDDGSDYFESSFPFSYEQTFSGSSNFTNSQPSAATSTKHVFHNHTYTLPQGRKSREELEAEAKREKEERATRSRDEKRAKAMKVWLSASVLVL